MASPIPQSTTEDPEAFAKLIQALLGPAVPSIPQLVATDAAGPVFTCLTDECFLNGACEEESVWAALDALPHAPDSVVVGGGAPLFPMLLAHASPTQKALDDGSVCLSVPLSPQKPSDVTITPYTTNLVEVPVPPASAPVKAKWWSPKKGAKESTALVAKKTFLPPKDKISISANWWGYSLYIPHSIMLHLPDPGMGSTLLAGLTAVLKFALANVPAALVGTPAIATLSAIAPIVLAIAGVITWAWAKVKGADKGNGVVFSATWLLPVAAIVRQWPVEKEVSKVSGEAAPSVQKGL